MTFLKDNTFSYLNETSRNLVLATLTNFRQKFYPDSSSVYAVEDSVQILNGLVKKIFSKIKNLHQLNQRENILACKFSRVDVVTALVPAVKILLKHRGIEIISLDTNASSFHYKLCENANLTVRPRSLFEQKFKENMDADIWIMKSDDPKKISQLILGKSDFTYLCAWLVKNPRFIGEHVEISVLLFKQFINSKYPLINDRSEYYSFVQTIREMNKALDKSEVHSATIHAKQVDLPPMSKSMKIP